MTSPVEVLPKPARCARQPCFLYGWKAHPYRKHGYK